MAIDYASARGQVRLLTSDCDEAAFILTDSELGGFLAMHGLTATATSAAQATVKRCAADVLDAMATSEALTSKVIRTQDLATDGPKTAAALRDHAARLRAQADDADAATDGGFFDVAEFSPYPYPVIP